MKNINIKAFGGLLWLIIILSASIFLSGGTFVYWQAWVFLSVFTVSVTAITLYLIKKDPELLARRIKSGPKAEKEKNQKIIQSLVSFTFLLVIIIPSLDHRFKWSIVPGGIAIAGDVLVFLGLLFVFFVYKENTFTSAIIEVDAKQQVISTGPYAIIRHPMYIGAIIMLLGIPPALGSWFGLFTILPISLVIICRLQEEEKFLVKHLAGYSEYSKKVKYRLLPFIW